MGLLTHRMTEAMVYFEPHDLCGPFDRLRMNAQDAGIGVQGDGDAGVAEALAVSLDKPLEWGVGFFFGNVELSLEL